VSRNLKLFSSLLLTIGFSILLSYSTFHFIDYRFISIDQYLLTFTYGDLVNFKSIILSPVSQVLYMPYKFIDQDQFIIVNAFILVILVFLIHSKYLNRYKSFDITFLALTSFVNGLLLMLIVENIYFVPFLLLLYYLFIAGESLDSKSSQYLFAYSLIVNPIMLFFVDKFFRVLLRVVFLTLFLSFITVMSVGSLEMLETVFLDFSWIDFILYSMFPICILYLLSRIFKSSPIIIILIYVAALILLLSINFEIHSVVFYFAIASILILQIFLRNRYHPKRSQI
jgi:hypothetical protein